MIQDLAVSVTEGDYCQNSQIHNVPDSSQSNKFNISSVLVSTDPDLCSTWLDNFEGVKLISGQIDISNSRIPILFYANYAALDGSNAIENVVIRTVGGPGEAIGPYGYEAAYIRNFSSPAVMVSLGYSGTSHGARFPGENFSLASQQISDFANGICRRLPNAKIILIGESLGGPITFSALQKVDACGGRAKALLVSPMVDSVDTQNSYSEQIEKIRGRSNTKKIVRIDGIYRSITSQELFTNFFPYDQRNLSLQERMDQRRDLLDRVWYIFGSEDITLRPDGVRRFISSNKSKSFIFNGMGHALSPQFEKEIANIVENVSK